MTTFNTGSPLVNARIELSEAVKNITDSLDVNFQIRCWVGENYPHLIKSQSFVSDNPIFFA